MFNSHIKQKRCSSCGIIKPIEQFELLSIRKEKRFSRKFLYNKYCNKCYEEKLNLK